MYTRIFQNVQFFFLYTSYSSLKNCNKIYSLDTGYINSDIFGFYSMSINLINIIGLGFIELLNNIVNSRKRTSFLIL